MSDTPNVNSGEPAQAPATEQAPVETPATNVDPQPASDTTQPAEQPAQEAAPQAPGYQQILSKRDADMQAVQQAQAQSAQQAQYQQIAQQQQPVYNQDGTAVLQAQIQQMQTQQQIQRIESQYQQAAAQHPELQRGSDSYDQDFDNLVWDQYLSAVDRGENTTPAEVAKNWKDYLSKQTEKATAAAREQAEKQVQTKQVNTEGAQVASATQDSPSNAQSQARQQFRNSGSEDDLVAYLNAGG
jgi:hypothetical protein